MIRLAAVLILVLPTITVGATGGTHPRSSFVALYTVLGTAAGSALGASLGGLERDGSDGSSGPLLRWGVAGGALGMILGYQVGKEGLITADRPTGSLVRGTRGSSACLGAILGQVAGLGFSLAQKDDIDWQGRAVWGNIALGSVIGAGIGALLPPLSFLPVPPARSARESSITREQDEIQPLLPPATESERFLADGVPAGRNADTTMGAPRTYDEIRALNASLLDPESRRMLKRSSIHLSPAPRARDIETTARPSVVPPIVASVTYLGLIEGALLGAAVAGALGPDTGKLGGRLSAGGIIGGLAGISASSSFSRPWREDGLFADRSETLETGQRMSGVLTGGIVGSLAGAAIGATLRNMSSGFGEVEALRAMLAGNVTGLIIGSIITSPRPNKR